MEVDFYSANIQEEWVSKLEQAAIGLANDGFIILDDLLSEKQSSLIKERLIELKEEDEFQKSGIGKQIEFQVASEIRGDFIRWIETNDLHPTIQVYYDFLKEAIHYFNRVLFTGVKDLESHYTYYPKGKFYLKHRDRFKKNPHRVISAVYYLNDDWKPGDGGELVIYNDKQEEISRIEPKMNRLAIFKSELVHEVLPCHIPRYSITTWMLDREKELTFL